MIKKEFCAENFTRVPEAIELGADRIELCDELDVGGTTPSLDMIKETVRYAHQHGVSVVVMIRPRGGSFVYDQAEKEQMLKEAKQAIELNADGIVFGCLTEEGAIDRPITEKLIAIAGSKESVFHMAFDFIPAEKQMQELDWLIEKGCTRILTRGGKSGTALENKKQINALIEKAQSQIELLPGGGITHEDLNEIKAEIKANQFHGTKILPFPDNLK
ncbi:copper homeostasis protein CutC [Alkalibacterium kapii]|uniref:PF03932 family protein CutC n=1 Tax=Alkalibacterium kapii TaxID=426704 RepID=A0A511AT76_9LACT|nr:copper homeostasis protein CutC [Alkalibacterium kapii]GEK91409.1 copper homeostasis protein CutC [Alkalibacterium kapii]